MQFYLLAIIALLVFYALGYFHGKSLMQLENITKRFELSKGYDQTIKRMLRG